MSRKYTLKLNELIDTGILDPLSILDEILAYASEDWVKQFCLQSYGGELGILFEDL